MHAFKQVETWRAHPWRIASSVWVPWAIGGLLLLGIAAGALIAGGREDLLPQREARPQALAFGLLLLAISLGTFGWLYAMLLKPLRRLGRDAERLAYGDLREPIEIRRYDEIGLIAHSLERVRLVLLRRIERDEARVFGESDAV